MLREGVVAAPMDIDLCLILGAGWPFHNGGITPSWTGRASPSGSSASASCPRVSPNPPPPDPEHESGQGLDTPERAETLTARGS